MTVKPPSPPASPEVSRKKPPFLIKNLRKKDTPKKKEPEKRNSFPADDELKQMSSRDHHMDNKNSPSPQNGVRIGDIVGPELNRVLPGTSRNGDGGSDSGHDSVNPGFGLRTALRPPVFGGGDGKKSKPSRIAKESKLEKKPSPEDIIDASESFPIPGSPTSPMLDRTNKNPVIREDNGHVVGKPAFKPLPAKPSKPTHWPENGGHDNSKEPLGKTKSLPFYNPEHGDLVESPDNDSFKELPTSPTGRSRDKRKDIVRPSVPPPAPPPAPPARLASPVESPTTPSPRGSPSRSFLKPQIKGAKPLIKGPKPIITSPKPEITIPKSSHNVNPSVKLRADKRGSVRKRGVSPIKNDSSTGQGGKAEVLQMAEMLYAQTNMLVQNGEYSKYSSELCSELDNFFKQCTRHVDSVMVKARFSFREILNSLESNTTLLRVRWSSASSSELERIIKDLHANVYVIRGIVQR